MSLVASPKLGGLYVRPQAGLVGVCSRLDHFAALIQAGFNLLAVSLSPLIDEFISHFLHPF